MELGARLHPPIQVLRGKRTAALALKIFIWSEKGAVAQGIISSGADGIKAAINIIENNV